MIMLRFKSTSLHCSAPISLRRWPVRRSKRTISLKRVVGKSSRHIVVTQGQTPVGRCRLVAEADGEKMPMAQGLVACKCVCLID